MALAIPTGAGNVVTASAGTANNLTVNKPANTADGDLLVIAAFFRNGTGIITPASGWTLVGTQNTVNEAVGLYYKAIPSASAEGATSYNFTTNAGSARAAMVCFRITGVNLAAIVDAAGTWAAYAQYNSCLIPAVTAASAYTALIAIAITNNATTGAPSVYTAPAGMTTVGMITADNTTSATACLWVGSEIRNAAGSTGTREPTIAPAALNVTGIMATFTGIPIPVPSISIVPDQVVSSAGWTATGGTALAVVGDNLDTTYVESGTLTGTEQVVRYGLPLLTASPAGLRVTVRCALDISTATVTTVNLYQGSTLLKSWTITPDSLTDITLTASAADVAGVTDWSALEVEIKARI